MGNQACPTNIIYNGVIGIQQDPTQIGDGRGTDYPFAMFADGGFTQPHRILACDADVPSTLSFGVIMNTNITVNDAFVRGNLKFVGTNNTGPVSGLIIGWGNVLYNGVTYKTPLYR